MANQIDTELKKQIGEEEIQVSRGPISEMAKKYGQCQSHRAVA